MYTRGKELTFNVINFRDRKALAKIRCRASSLLVETGRYSNGQYSPAEERVCTIFVMKCRGSASFSFKV